VTRITEDPFVYLDNLLAIYTPVVSKKQSFCGGLAGYWGYELNHWIEPKVLSMRQHDLPNLAVGLYLWAIVIDHQEKKMTLQCHPSLAVEKKQRILNHIANIPQTIEPNFQLQNLFSPDLSKQDYQNKFQCIQNYIKSGDCYQINLTQRFSASYQGDAWFAYLKLRQASPTLFSAYMELDDLTVLSHSPERLIRLQGDHVQAKPIKGTIKRSLNAVEDRLLAESLLQSEKDRAENLMIVDLLRNDLNRHCEPHSVRVSKLFELISTANVHHLVSTIEGTLKKKMTPLSLLKHIFPGGSVTGVPKIRAMQIIHELESHARSVYCGAIGYVSFCGTMDVNIPIRTLVAKSQVLRCWGGGAIVADSDCELEYQESKVKVKNLLHTLENIHIIHD
ncbi:MAG: aminodeoxychorismate synthase component I, partial [Endozoicomonadaceae bacterium]|nr:aminodeoxychorismate synthase component I [Endozoicomonadaceae bacterium]